MEVTLKPEERLMLEHMACDLRQARRGLQALTVIAMAGVVIAMATMVLYISLLGA